MKKPITRIFLILFTFSVTAIHAQVDPHFSQYYANPLWLNPALAGVINGDIRLNTNVKNQWSSVNNAYVTGAVSADFRLNKNLALGVSILDQSAGGNTYNHFSAYANVSYGIAVSYDGNQRLNFGMQAGVLRRSFDSNNLQFGNQYNPVSGYDPTLSSNENLVGESNSVFDSGAGIFYYDGDPLKITTLFGGVSVSHLNRPADSFSGSLDTKLPIRYTVHGGARIRATDNLDLIPNALYINQQKANIKAAGLYSEIRLNSDRALIIGTLFRWNDAAVADLGYHLNNLIIGASYDFNTSSLNRATGGNGGIEISLSYLIRKRIQQPEPICPRL